MWELLDRFSPGQLIGLVATVGAMLGWIISMIVTQWRRVRVAEIEATLKQQMLDKGLSPPEIEQILKASKRGSKEGDSGHPGKDKSDKAKLVKQMVENSYSGEDIERVIKALEGPGSPGNAGDSAALAEKVAAARKMVENGMEAADIERVMRAFQSPPGRGEEAQRVMHRV